MFDAEAHRRKHVKIDFKASGNLCSYINRRARFEEARRLFPPEIREHFHRMHSECPVPLYEEGTEVQIHKEPMWVVLRIWNEAEQGVIYLLESLVTLKICCLHEDLLVREDDIHGERVKEFFAGKMHY